MTRLAIAICLLLPVSALAEGTEEKAELPDLAADALVENAGGSGRISGLEMSRSFRHNGATTMCATSDARDGNGNFKGLTFWQVTFNADGTEVVSVRNVTGLISDCYGEKYQKYGN